MTKPKQPPPRRRPGKPMIEDEPQRRHNVMLTDAHIKRAREIGHGNISAGIRLALIAYGESSES